MVHLKSSRKSSVRLQPLPVMKEVTTGPLIEFRWSISAAKLASIATKSPPPILPPIVNTTSIRKCSIPSSTPTDRDSIVSALFPMQKRSRRTRQLPKIQETNRSERASSQPPKQRDDGSNERFSPLLLTYSQLRRVEPPPETKRSHLSILAPLSDKQSSVSFATNKSLLSSNPSSTSSTISAISTEDVRMTPDFLVRLRTPQLRRMQVSEKYINEAKQLYFNASLKVFVPRVSIAPLVS